MAIATTVARPERLFSPYRGLARSNTIGSEHWNGYDGPDELEPPLRDACRRQSTNPILPQCNMDRSAGHQVRLQHIQILVQLRDEPGTVEDDGNCNRPHVTGRIRMGVSRIRPSAPGQSRGRSDQRLAAVLSTPAPRSRTTRRSYTRRNVNRTGSPSYAARIRVVGDPGSGCSSDQYAQFNTAAFAGPTYNSLGLESGQNLLGGCFENITDLSIARNIRLGGGRQIQLRVDMFNAFNTVVIDAAELPSIELPTDLRFEHQFLRMGHDPQSVGRKSRYERQRGREHAQCSCSCVSVLRDSKQNRMLGA